MIGLVLLITILSAYLVVHVYIGYPLILWCLTKLTKGKSHIIDEGYRPSVTLLVSCYNEIDVIEEKIANCFALDYPTDKLNFIVISDGSDDGTDEAVAALSNERLSIIRQEGRLGKTSAINLAMESVSSDIVVFSDANAMYQPDAILKLVRHFADANVGYVVGAALYTDGEQSTAAASEDLYWRYEIALKKMESSLHSVVGGDGAIYAIRRNAYIPLEQQDINDFVNPLQIIEQGYRGLFDSEAICLEETAGDFAKEARRKQRIVNRSFRGLMKVRAVLNPSRFGFFSFEVISHKLLRWLMPVFLALFTLGSIALAYAGIQIFQLITLLALVFFVLVQCGYLLSRRQRSPLVFSIPYYFYMVNYYSLIGVITALQGNIQVTWSSPRHQNNTDSILSSRKILPLCFANFVIGWVFIDILNRML